MAFLGLDDERGLISSDNTRRATEDRRLVTLDVDLDEPCPAEYQRIERSSSDLDDLDSNPT